jgi:hypothetical protein
MFGLFDPPYRRLRDERDIRDFYAKYGEDAPVVLSNRAIDRSLSPRDRRHWRRLARKARRQRNEYIGGLKTT